MHFCHFGAISMDLSTTKRGWGGQMAAMQLGRCFKPTKTIPNSSYLTFFTFRMLRKSFFKMTIFAYFCNFYSFWHPTKKTPFLLFLRQNTNFRTFWHSTLKKKRQKFKIFLEKVFSDLIPPGNQISWPHHDYRSTQSRNPPKKKRFSHFCSKVKILAEYWKLAKNCRIN